MSHRKRSDHGEGSPPDLIAMKSKNLKSPNKTKQQQLPNPRTQAAGNPFDPNSSPITRVLNDIDMYLDQVGQGNFDQTYGVVEMKRPGNVSPHG